MINGLGEAQVEAVALVSNTQQTFGARTAYLQSRSMGDMH